MLSQARWGGAEPCLCGVCLAGVSAPACTALAAAVAQSELPLLGLLTGRLCEMPGRC